MTDYGSAEDLLARIRTIERAIAGVGRPRALTMPQCREAWRLLNEDDMPVADVAGRFDIHPQTLRRLMKQGGHRIGHG